MSMLADRRFRKKYTLTPRGKALYDDDSRFGTKMLQKMGWSKEKGLGAQEDGSKDFVRVQFKNDASGLGYENRDDQWTQHEENFNGFLKSLNTDDVENSNEQNESASEEERCVGFGFSTEATGKQKQKDKLKEKLSGQSLEERSKKSKARVHYKKFTRGKDLTQYSEKDLANIFGKKGNESEEMPKADINEQLGANENKFKKEKEEVFENPLIISTGLSVSDYFKQKMDARKKQAEVNINNEDSSSTSDKESEESKVKSKKRSELIEPDETIESVEVSSSKKKSKKKKLQDESEENEAVSKKKKRKNEDDFLLESNVEETEKTLITEQENQIDGVIESTEGKARKKKKKSKKQEVDENETYLEHVEVNSEEIPIEDNTTIRKKKKSKKDKNQKLSDLEETNQVDIKQDIIQNNIDCLENEESNILKLKNKSEETKKKKKQKSKKGDDDDGINNITSTVETEVNTIATEQKVKKSKKKKLPNTDMETEDSAEGVNNVSCNDNKECEDNGVTEALSLEELTDKCKSYNTYNLSTFCAEKFRNVNFEKFPGSNMANINGYSHGDDLELNVQYIAKDEERIMRLWSCLSTKYNDSKALYHQYVRKIYKTKNLKNKQKPRLNVARFKKRNIFQGI